MDRARATRDRLLATLRDPRAAGDQRRRAFGALLADGVLAAVRDLEPVLVELARDPAVDPLDRVWAATELIEPACAARRDTATAVLRALTADPRPGVAVAASEALAEWGGPADRARCAAVFDSVAARGDATEEDRETARWWAAHLRDGAGNP